MKPYSLYLLTILQVTLVSAIGGPPTPVRDGSHDFDFLIGNWKARVRRLPDRLVGSNAWIEYNGISNHKKLLDTNANFEEFEVDNPDKHLHIKGQTLRLYNPDSHQWSIYLLDLDKGVLSVPPVVGEFNGTRGRVLRSGTIQRTGDSGALSLAESFAEVGPDGAVLLRGRWKNVGN